MKKFLIENSKNKVIKQDYSQDLAINLRNALKALQLSYSQNNNAQFYASFYNQLRNVYGDFLIKKRIPRNLITEVSLQQLPIQQEKAGFYRQIFIKVYYSPESPWLTFANNEITKTNSKLVNYDAIINAFAEHFSLGQG